MAIHLRPTAALAPRALLPGDPGRALALAQLLLEAPLMFNHNRGLWGYSGEARDGSGALTIQSTGIGGPSAAIVLEELSAMGLQRAVRVGTCGALDASIELGELLIASSARAHDGASRALGASELVPADARLSAALCAAAPPGTRGGEILTSDLFYDERPLPPSADRALAVEMEAAALFTVGARRGVAVGCALAVSDLLPRGARGARIDDDGLLRAGERLGELGLAALNL